MKVKGLHSSQHVKGYDSRLAKSETKDCVVNAIASAFDIEYDEAHEICRVHFHRTNRCGTRTWYFAGLAKSGLRIGDRAFALLAKSILTRKEGTKKIPITVNEFVERYKTGRYVVLISRHAFAVVDGVIIGNFEDARKLRCRVEDAVRVFAKSYVPVNDVPETDEDLTEC